MSAPMKLDDFLKSQGGGFTATIELLPEKPDQVKITPYRHDHGCGCSASFDLAKNMISTVTPTGQFHYCCGKRLQIAAVDFTKEASIPVADLIKRIAPPHAAAHAVAPHHPSGNAASQYGVAPYGAYASRSAAPSLVGRWPIPWTSCELVCIEVCTEFCGPTGWECCGWETRCAINCNGYASAYSMRVR